MIITLAALPTQIATMSTRHLVRFAWPFIDLNCQSIADRFPLCDTLKGPQTGEIWFSWAVWSESWTILERCADLAPSYVSDHLRYLATAAEFGGKSFTEVEEGFDYGRMITPWNHFHLMWLARHLHDDQSALEHARRLCSTTRVGEIRTGRFINRILHWPAFRDIRQALGDDIESARLQLRLTTTEASLGFARNIAEFWRLRGE